MKKSPSRFLGSIALILAACDEPVASTSTGVLERELETDDAILIYESIRVLDPKGALVTSKVIGEVTPGIFQRVGRLWSYFDEEYLYHENAWSRSIEGSNNTEHGYQILPVNGTCVMGSGSTLYTRGDASRDTKSMVALNSTDVTLAGACLEVTLDNYFVTSAGVTTMTYCYLSNVNDDL